MGRNNAFLLCESILTQTNEMNITNKFKCKHLLFTCDNIVILAKQYFFVVFVLVNIYNNNVFMSILSRWKNQITEIVCEIEVKTICSPSSLTPKFRSHEHTFTL